MIKDYFIASDNCSNRLAKIVMELMQLGWAPLGGVSLAIDQGRSTYVQAMIKET